VSLKFIRAGFYSHVKGNFFLYVLVLTALMIGIVVGAFTVNNITEVQREQIKEYINKFYQIAKSVELNPVQIFKQSLLNNFVTVFLLWILGATIVGIPFIFLIVGARGFTLGFSIGVMIKEMQFKGVLLTILGVLPQRF